MVKLNLAFSEWFEILSKEINPKEPEFTHCSCTTCGWKGLVSDCETEQEQDGWENPPYTIHLCPICEDGGCIDDYYIGETS